ncbi:RNA polymerase sigma factor [Cyclobacterium xiamenense]|uniref:RNA polymerase sigma factor n=1 Tax=Cyclobacterium xiamenense TaxID=1297121 RepID=UPI0035D10087
MEILSGCLKNDPVAQRMLFDTYYRQTFRTAMRYLANHHDVEDVVSVAYSKVFSRIHQFEYRGEGSLGKWIFTIVIHESIRFLKTKKEMVFHEDEALMAKSISQPPPAGYLDMEEVAEILDDMPKGYRTVFNLYAIEGYSHKEVAEMLQINENTSKSQLSKARNYIIQQLRINNHAVPRNR